MGKLDINILGSSFSIEAKEDNQYLEDLLAYYTQVTNDVKHMAKNTDSKKIAILSGLMICDELFKDRTKAENVKKVLENQSFDEKKMDHLELHEAEKLTLKMIKAIDGII